eukprot:5997424-Pyramimonas_sp.AAC.1
MSYLPLASILRCSCRLALMSNPPAPAMLFTRALPTADTSAVVIPQQHFRSRSGCSRQPPERREAVLKSILHGRFVVGTRHKLFKGGS